MDQTLQAVLEISNKFKDLVYKLEELSDKMDKQYMDLNTKMDNQYVELNKKIDSNHVELSEKIRKVEVRIGVLATEFNSLKADIFLVNEKNNML